ncbi:MAG: hypothetical protein JXR65_12075 [Bacteroidales bacterium]|nr:hypothetical protein [Bacteroidales bacterium]
MEYSKLSGEDSYFFDFVFFSPTFNIYAGENDIDSIIGRGSAILVEFAAATSDFPKAGNYPVNDDYNSYDLPGTIFFA